MATDTRDRRYGADEWADAGPRRDEDARFDDPFTDTEGAAVDPDTMRRLNKFAELLDDRYRIPGTNYRVGIDGLIGMVPGIGDTASALLASYVVFEAYRLKVPPSLLVRMAGNIGMDWAIGSIPIAGDLFDFAFKANRKNVRLLLEHLRSRD
jgi:hypothetical protein